MAVDRASGFRHRLISAEELSALQSPVTRARGVPLRDNDIYTALDLPDLDSSNSVVLPIGADDDQGGTSEQAPVETYLAWLNRLSQLARSPSPDFTAMLTAADNLDIPRHTALQDIFDALGISAAANEDPQLQDWMSMLLRNGDDLDLDALSNVLEMMRTLADPERRGKVKGGRAQDRAVAEVTALKDQLTQALGQLDRLQRRTDSMMDQNQAAIEALSRQVVAWETYRTNLQGFQQGVTAALPEGLGVDEVTKIADTMQALRAPGEVANFVSVAEWQALIAGINDARELTTAEATIATGQVADELLARETAGLLTIDPAVRDDIVQAQADAQGGTEIHDRGTAA